MRGECSTHGRYEKSIHILVGNRKGEDIPEDVSEDGRIILE